MSTEKQPPVASAGWYLRTDMTKEALETRQRRIRSSAMSETFHIIREDLCVRATSVFTQRARTRFRVNFCPSMRPRKLADRSRRRSARPRHISPWRLFTRALPFRRNKEIGRNVSASPVVFRCRSNLISVGRTCVSANVKRASIDAKLWENKLFTRSPRSLLFSLK